ncbi:MAG: DUF4433 domain-containing protein [Cellvibrionaceae bacterium]
MPNSYPNLNPQKALIWRIVHRHNLPWILENGLHAANNRYKSGDWVNIGNEELIDRRSQRGVPISPGGVLGDYVPFYFTPFSPMMYNIHTGRGGVRRQNNRDIIILVSSLYKIAENGLGFIFTDRHAYPVTARFFNDLAALDEVDWPLLQQRNFQRNPDDPGQIERYQAEALIHGHVPISALLGAVCYTRELEMQLKEQAGKLGVELDIRHLPHWYF